MTEDQAQDLLMELEELREQCQDSLDSMPYHLQDTSTSGQLLQDRIELLDEWASGIECIDWAHTLPEEAADIVEETNPGIS